MKFFSIISLLIVLSTSLISQDVNDHLYFKYFDKEYSWQNNSKQQLDSFYYNLEPIKNSTSVIHARISLSSTGQIIDIFSVKEGGYKGLVTNVIADYRTTKILGYSYAPSVIYQEFYQKVAIDCTLINSIVDSLSYLGLFQVPTDSLIPNWKNSFIHCDGIVIQTKINDDYKEKIYHCPWGQADSINHSRTILKAEKLLSSALQLDSLYKVFMHKLPKGRQYSHDGYRMVYIMTNEENETYVKGEPAREYLRGIKDSIDNYFAIELQRLQIDLSKSFCSFYDFKLHYGKNGDLRRVSSPRQKLSDLDGFYELGYYVKEVFSLHRCRRELHKIFKEIDFGNFNLQCGFVSKVRVESDGTLTTFVDVSS